MGIANLKKELERLIQEDIDVSEDFPTIRSLIVTAGGESAISSSLDEITSTISQLEELLADLEKNPEVNQNKIKLIKQAIKIVKHHREEAELIMSRLLDKYHLAQLKKNYEESLERIEEQLQRSIRFIKETILAIKNQALQAAILKQRELNYLLERISDLKLHVKKLDEEYQANLVLIEQYDTEIAELEDKFFSSDLRNRLKELNSTLSTDDFEKVLDETISKCLYRNNSNIRTRSDLVEFLSSELGIDDEDLSRTITELGSDNLLDRMLSKISGREKATFRNEDIILEKTAESDEIELLERMVVDVQSSLSDDIEEEAVQEGKSIEEIIEIVQEEASKLEEDDLGPDLTQEPSELVDESVDEEGSLNFDDPGFTLESWEEKIKKLGERLNSGELDDEGFKKELRKIQTDLTEAIDEVYDDDDIELGEDLDKLKHAVSNVLDATDTKLAFRTHFKELLAVDSEVVELRTETESIQKPAVATITVAAETGADSSLSSTKLDPIFSNLEPLNKKLSAAVSLGNLTKEVVEKIINSDSSQKVPDHDGLYAFKSADNRPGMLMTKVSKKNIQAAVRCLSLPGGTVKWSNLSKQNQIIADIECCKSRMMAKFTNSELFLNAA